MENSNKNNIKELAKELCKKSGCHHKCHDTKDCVVEDEAKAIIGDNLPSTLKNEEKISGKEKQIEEGAKVIKSSLDGLGCGNFNFTGDEISTMFATALYNAGYRKQSEGEWIEKNNHKTIIGKTINGDKVYAPKDHCSKCGVKSKDMGNYCSYCGAKMKGGEE